MQEITSEEQLQEVIASSQSQPVFLFKHSTRCPISAGAKRHVEAYLENADEPPPFHLLLVVESRPVSRKAAELLDVDHQSPQLILLKDGRAVWDTSHHGITEEAIRKALQ